MRSASSFVHDFTTSSSVFVINDILPISSLVIVPLPATSTSLPQSGSDR